VSLGFKSAIAGGRLDSLRGGMSLRLALPGARVCDWAVAAGLVLVFGVLAIAGKALNWLPSSPTCIDNASRPYAALVATSCHLSIGETLSAVSTGFSYVRDGPAYWFLQHGANGGVGGDLYIHNVNLGAFVVYLSALAGASTLAAPAIATAAAFTLGLLYGYLFVLRASGSRPLALVFLGLFSTSIYFNLAFGLNLLRGWEWLPLFGCAFHLLAASRSTRFWRSPHLFAYVLYAVLGLAIGYDFFAFLAGLSLAIVAVLASPGRRQVQAGMFVAASLIGVLALRQIQVIGGVGLSTWWTDLLYAGGAKSALIGRLVKLPDPATIAAWYTAHHIDRGDPLAATDWKATLAALAGSEWWIERLGPLPAALAAGGLAAAGRVLLIGRKQPLPEWDAPARTVLTLALGQLIGFAALSHNNVWYYLFRGWPMVISLVCLALAFALIMLARWGPATGLVAAVGVGIALLLTVLSQALVALAGRGHPAVVERHMPAAVSIATLIALIGLGWPLWRRWRGAALGRQQLAAPIVLSLALFAGQWAVVQAADFAYLRLEPYPWPPHLPLDALNAAAPHNLSANFGRQFKLIGYEASTVAFGQDVQVTLYWECDAQDAFPWEVFVGLIDPTTQRSYAEEAPQPRPGQRPVWTWLPGEVVKETHLVHLPRSLPPASNLAYSVVVKKVEGDPALMLYTVDSGEKGTTYIFGSLQAAPSSPA